MTAKYELTKLYRRNAEISVTIESFGKFLLGENNTLDHIVNYHHQDVLVRAKPKKPNYKHYIVGFNPYGYSLPTYL